MLDDECGIQTGLNGNHKNDAMRWEKTTPSPCLGVLHWAHPSLCKDIRMFWWFFFVSSWAKESEESYVRFLSFPWSIEYRAQFTNEKREGKQHPDNGLLAWCHTISNSTNVFASGTWLASPSATSNKKKLQRSKVHTILLYILVMRFTSLPRISRISPNLSSDIRLVSSFWGYGLLPSPKAPDETCHKCHLQQATTTQPPQLLSLRMGSIMRWSSWRLNSANSRKKEVLTNL